MADSCHLGFWKSIPVFTTPLTVLAINFFLEVWLRCFSEWKSHKVYKINVYHHYSTSRHSLVVSGIRIPIKKAFMPFFFLFLYILKFGSFLLVYSYFMPVWGIVKTAASSCRGQLDARKVEGNGASSCPQYRGAVVCLFRQTAMNKLFYYPTNAENPSVFAKKC